MEDTPRKEYDSEAEEAELMQRIFSPPARNIVIGTAVPSPEQIAIYYSELEQIRAAHMAGALAAQNTIVG